MIKEIKYNGYSATPSDYECPDGDLAMAMGLLQENGAMKPVLPPKEVLQLETGASVMYIHETSNFRHYIILKSTDDLAWWDGMEDSNTVSLRTFSTEIYQVTAIGNTLVVLASDGMHYFLWKDETVAYLYLGSKLPNLDIVFGLQAESVQYSKKYPTENLNIGLGTTVHYAFNEEWEEINNATEDTINSWTNTILAKVNKLINEEVTKKTRFIYPFFVRYAYRLYDGSLTMHSAPILMIPSSNDAPLVMTNDVTFSDMTSWNIDILAFPCSLSYQSFNKNILSEWGDIIDSIDIFISLPMWRYDQSGKVSLGKEAASGYTIAKYMGGDLGAIDGLGDKYTYTDVATLYGNVATNNFGIFKLPSFDKEQYYDKICSCANFYHIASIKLATLSETDTLVPFEIEDLNSLSVREVMTDDYQSHDTIIPKYSFVYNSRFNITSILRHHFVGFNPSSMLCRSENTKGLFYVDTNAANLDVYVKINGKYNKTESLYKHAAPISYLSWNDIGFYTYYPHAHFIFYPDTNATEMIIHQDGYGTVKYPLHSHPTLNGAYYFAGLEANPVYNSLIADEIIPEVSSNNYSDITNKIYTSEVNNPFYFPLLGINTVGTGNILGICAAAKALSEGQFGQFPLYAFTTEGVWALEVSSTGTYSAKQPITRDVCINPDSITQIDSAVLFATDRGIMHISGSTVQCISDNLNTEDLFSIADLPKCDKLIDIFNAKADDTEQITIDDVAILPFLDFLADCRMIYDYTNQRIIVYNPAVRYAYVYSMKSQTWGMMRSNIVDNVNSYPEALAMADGATLVDFSKSDAETTTSLIITRPFKIDSPDTFKTINTIIQRGVFRSTHVQQVLYGSNDLFNWHTVWSSVDKIMRGFRGTPYKAYRLALVCKFDKGESIYGCTVVYEPRMTNQVR